MFDRIVCNPEILGGKPTIKGTRISVEIILEWLASGGSMQNILDEYTHLTREDVEQALATMETELEPPFIITAKRTGQDVNVRVRTVAVTSRTDQAEIDAQENQRSDRQKDSE